MDHKNTIKSLYRTDETTARNIMEHYPPQWNMDRVFQKSYQKYLAQKKEAPQEESVVVSECTEISDCAGAVRTPRRVWRTGSYFIFAAASVGMFLFLFRVSNTEPPTTRFPDATNESQADPPENDLQGETTAAVQTEYSGTTFITEVTSSPENSAESTSTTAAETIAPASTQPAETELPDQTTAAVIAETVPLTETAAVPETSSETTAFTETETTPETTQTTPVTEPHGYIEVAESGGSRQLTYARASDVQLQECEHSFEADGFTLTEKVEYNAEYEYRSMHYSLIDENGQQYAINQFRYDYFSFSSSDLMREYSIGGKTAYLFYQEDPDALCRLIWDDGCHVCVMYSQYKDLANMELLLQSQTGEKIVVPEFESYFKMEEPTGSGTSGRIVYVLGNSDPVQERTHSFAADGFTLTDITEYNAGQPYHSTNYTLTDENGQQYLIMQEQYAYFAASYNPDAVPLTKSYTIGGKNVFLVYEDNLDSLCRLMWDDGCHICTVMSQYKDLAKMELLVQSQITE